MALLLLLAITGALQAAERVAAHAKPAPGKPKSFSHRPEVRDFIDQMALQHGFARNELAAVFGKAVFQPDIIRAMTPPTDPTVRSWQNYRANFVNPQRVEAGLRFRERHAPALQRAVAQYGVPEEIILAIIGVETVYGRNMGRYRVIDALATLAFDYPRRAEYFRAELEHFLLYARDTGSDVLGVRGSYAGAIGMPQFMPGSYRRYAVDYDGDGQTNLIESAADAIGSVANFLKEHGWEAGRPVAFPARVEGEAWKKLVDAGIKPAWRLNELGALGVFVAERGGRTGLAGSAAPASDPANDALSCLVELETPGQPALYWIGLQNFYTLTRYNRSSFYAIAVLELALALREGMPAAVEKAS